MYLKIENMISKLFMNINEIICMITGNVNGFVRRTRKGADFVYNPNRFGELDKVIAKVNELDYQQLKAINLPDFGYHLYYPTGETTDLPLVVYIHGGGWVANSPGQFASYCKLIASQGFIVANVNYSLSPESIYPISTLQTIEVINYLLTTNLEINFNTNSFFIGGNSAGAHLATQIGALISNPTYAKKMDVKFKFPTSSLKGIIGINGIYDFSTVHKAKFPGMNGFLWAYTGMKDYLKSPKLEEMSPINYIDVDFPPMYLTVGDDDSLIQQSKQLITHLDKLNLKYTKNLWEDISPKLNHDFAFNMTNIHSQQVFKQIIEFLKHNTTNY